MLVFRVNCNRLLNLGETLGPGFAEAVIAAFPGLRRHAAMGTDSLGLKPARRCGCLRRLTPLGIRPPLQPAGRLELRAVRLASLAAVRPRHFVPRAYGSSFAVAHSSPCAPPPLSRCRRCGSLRSPTAGLRPAHAARFARLLRGFAPPMRLASLAYCGASPRLCGSLRSPTAGLRPAYAARFARRRLPSAAVILPGTYFIFSRYTPS